MMEVDGLFPILSCRQWESLIRKTRPMCIESFSTAWYIEWLALLKWLWVRALWSPLYFWLSGHSPSPLVSFRFVRVGSSSILTMFTAISESLAHRFLFFFCLPPESHTSQLLIASQGIPTHHGPRFRHRFGTIISAQLRCPPHRAIPF